MPDFYSTGLQEAEYEGVRFPCGAFDVQSGHDHATHTVYLRDGADLEPCGLRPRQGTLVVPLVNDTRLVQRYGTILPDLLLALDSTFAAKPIGSLTHPLYGTFAALIESWPTKGDPKDGRNSVGMVVHWIEHNATAMLTSTDAGSRSSPQTAAEIAAASADATMAATGLSGWSQVAPLLSVALGLIELGATSVAQITARIMAVVEVVDGNAALVTAATYSDAATAQEDCRTALYQLLASLVPEGVRQWTLPVTLALWEVAAILGVEESDLAAANSVDDPLFVPAGTAITLP